MKPFSWSYSKIKNFSTCPLKHAEVDLRKHYTDSSEQLDWGNAVHKAMANACTGKAPLPATMAPYQKWVDRVLAGPGVLLVEQKYALTKNFQPTTYFGPDVWYRGIGDVVRIDGSVALGLDWKTGKVSHDSKQLMLMAQCIMAFNPAVKVVRTEFVWLKEGCCTPDKFYRKTIANEWLSLLPRVKELETAAVSNIYPPKQSALCFAHCPVATCVYHGKRMS